MEFHEFMEWVRRRTIQEKWRVGQALFNCLQELKPDLAAKMRSTEVDPFQAVSTADRRYRACVQFLRDTWVAK